MNLKLLAIGLAILVVQITARSVERVNKTNGNVETNEVFDNDSITKKIEEESVSNNEIIKNGELYLESEAGLEKFLKENYEPAANKQFNLQQIAEWNYATDIKEETANELVKVTKETAAFQKYYHDRYFGQLNLDNYEKEVLKRQAQKLKVLGDAKLNDEDLQQLIQVRSKMTEIYSTAKICPYDKQKCDIETEGLSLDPGITNALASSRNYDEQVYLWNAWREQSGKKMRSEFKQYVQLSNKMAKANEFKDLGDMWKSAYETDDFESVLEKLWEDVKPLYNELHTYVKRKLKRTYGSKIDVSDGKIPAHVFGNMWAQSWVNLADIVKPYPDASQINITEALEEKEYTVQKMFETSDEFYKSLGLEDNSMSYGEKAMIEKPEDKEVLCHASAWDFSDGKDFRIKMCTKIKSEDFITIHHEMGHIQYYIQYKDQPVTLREGANPGFHEAIGDTIALSVATPKHLKKIGLLDDYDDNEQFWINALMDMALQRVAFLPFGYLIDKWRWDVFSEKVKEDQWNAHWWKLRGDIQNVKPPKTRTEEDFDAGAKFHVAGDSQYINYFIAHILEFQMYRSLCIAADQYDPKNPDKPLHKCDFHESKAAGTKLKNGLMLGSSTHWSKALEVMTGEKTLSASALLDYFKPLQDFLQKENAKFEENAIKELLQNKYETESSVQANEQVKASWNYATDINDDNANKLVEATEKLAAFEKKYFDEYFDYLDEEEFKDESISRQVKKLRMLGDAKLEEADLKKLTEVKSKMTGIYSSAKICPYQKPDCDLDKEGLSLDPGITEALAKSKDYDEQQYLWNEWRKKSGKLIKSEFETYVELSNKAAKANGFTDKGELWRSAYETENFEQEVDKLWNEIEPLYNELHRYVLRRLQLTYGDKIDVADGKIPAHLFGNMWAQSWVNLADELRPYRDVKGIDVTAALIEKGYNAKRMFETSDEFYKSLKLESNEMSYGEKAMIVKPEGKEVLCHASAWDFSDGQDFRIKMCTKVNFEDFITIYHEMGHIQYYQLYKNQPITFRGGANPGFHEAVGDTIALSAATPKHLKKIGLLDDYEDNDKFSINTLMDMALQRLAFLPFGLLIDKWRWDVFSGKVDKTNWNSKWWEYRQKYQKVKPPQDRTEDDFDPGAKYHVAGDSQYINYFIAHILEFQLYRSLCIEAGEYDPSDPKSALHKCDFHGSTAVGEKLRAGLQLGASKHWKVALKEITGEEKLSVSALKEYFKPLQDFLEKENQKPYSQQEVKQFLEKTYLPRAANAQNQQVQAEWAYATDITEENAKKLVEATKELARFEKLYHDEYFGRLDATKYKDEQISRQIKKLGVIGESKLDETDLEEITNTKNKMTEIYSTAKVCPFEKQQCDVGTEGLSLEPGITNALATSKNYDEQLYLWDQWRKKTGKEIKPHFKKYVELSNKMAVANGFKDKGDLWRSAYETENFENEIDELWKQVKPLYESLHTYVTKKLKATYGDKLDVADGNIPAHVFGNMWAQSWINIESLAKPYPDAGSIDVTAALIEKKYTAKKMFEKSDEFYQSLGLEDNSMSYGDKAMIEKPEGKEVLCHASAWDFYDAEDFRIKMCTEVNYEDFITIHHEMGHIQYFIQYKGQPVTLRDGANPGFHEAIGDTIALSVATPKHLKEIELLDKNFAETKESSINTLMNMALERVAFLPFGLLIDKWRWDVFSGLKEEEWNAKWWEYRKDIQKVKRPKNQEADDFDPAAKYHVAGDSQYINYFVAHILEFQLYRSLCIEAGEYDPEKKDVPLHKCDFYKSTKAGDKLRAGLSLGASKHWTDALKAITGEEKLSAAALLEYFEPLHEFLKEYNKEEEDKPDEASSNTVAIAVGSVVGVLAVGGIGFYLYKRFKK